MNKRYQAGFLRHLLLLCGCLLGLLVIAALVVTLLRIPLDLDDGVKVNYGKFGDLLSDVKAIHGKAV